MALRILCLFSLLAFSYANFLPLFDPMIVRGEDAKVGEIPYQVSIQEKNSSFHFCGGSILNDNYVITAAHCVDDKYTDEIKVIAGTIDLNDTKSSQHNVTEIILHKEYNQLDSWRHDIALLRVKTPFIKSVTVGHVPLPPKGHVVNDNDIAVVSGWGTLGWEWGPTTTKLKRVNIFIGNKGYCRHKYNNLGYNIYRTQVCAYDPSVPKGVCYRDDGGPLTVDGKLVGLVSWFWWNRGCSDIDFPTVYTRVVFYLDWIKDNAV